MPPVKAMIAFDDDPVVFALVTVCTYHRFMICREALKDFVPEAAIRARAPVGLRIAEAVCARLTDHPSREAIESAAMINI